MRRMLAALLIVAGSDPAGAASATAQASVQVVEPVKVIGLLGTPLTLADVLAALQSATAGPATGSRLIRLPDLVPRDDADAPGFDAGSDPGVAEAMMMASPVNGSAGAGTLQGALAAAVSVAPNALKSGRAEGGPATITVAFN